MITVKEIAKRCKVSPSTVSNILNGRANVSEKTRQRVLACVKETGYQPNYFAQNMRRQQNHMLCIITEDLSVFGTNPMVESIMAYCEENGYRTVLINLRLYKKWRDTWYDDNKKIRAAVKPAIQEALAIRASGIIYVAGHCRQVDYFPPDFPIPLVITYAMAKDGRYPSVVIDDEKGGYDTTEYLISKGHKNIGLIAGAMDNQHTKSRLLGCQKALFKAGMLFDPARVHYGDWLRGTGYLGAKQLISTGSSAIFCMNDAMALGVYDYCHEMGLAIGTDISVVGYDDMEFADCLRPALTTNRIELSEIGRTAAEVMINALAGKEKTEETPMVINVPCTMIERGSVNVL